MQSVRQTGIPTRSLPPRPFLHPEEGCPESCQYWKSPLRQVLLSMPDGRTPHRTHRFPQRISSLLPMQWSDTAVHNPFSAMQNLFLFHDGKCAFPDFPLLQKEMQARIFLHPVRMGRSVRPHRRTDAPAFYSFHTYAGCGVLPLSAAEASTHAGSHPLL